jgi:succinate dehydrogenase / fumarate reductase flavoprotein subunit
VCLDLAWIAEKIPDAPEHIRRKLPGMYHQFKELAGIDITKEPMEVGPTTHYAMGGIRVDADTQMSTLPGLFAAGECAGGLHGANRLGGNSLSDLLVFGKRAGEHAAAFAREHGAVQVGTDQVEASSAEALAPLDRPVRSDDRGPFRIQTALQELMQDKVGIVRTEEELTKALDRLAELSAEASTAGVGGHREFNPGWHTALDLGHMLTVSEAVTRAARERKESRGAHSRIDFPDKDPEYGRFNLVIRRGATGDMDVRREPIPPMRRELDDIIREQG